jgi:hypothetical protein
MKKAFVILLAKRASVLLSAFVLLLIFATPALANQPAFRFTEDVTGDVFECEDRLYTIISGELWSVIHEGESASGNMNYTITVKPHQVIAVDGDGNEYSLVGAFWFGATLNANTGGFQGTDTLKLQVVGQGSGVVDSVNVVFHFTAQPNNIVVKDFVFGTCGLL